MNIKYQQEIKIKTPSTNVGRWKVCGIFGPGRGYTTRACLFGDPKCGHNFNFYWYDKQLNEICLQIENEIKAHRKGKRWIFKNQKFAKAWSFKYLCFFFLIIILLLQFLGGCFLFLFFISTNWLIYVPYGNVSFGTSWSYWTSFHFCHLLHDNIWQWQLNHCFLNLRFNAWFVNFDCISKSLNVEWKQFSPLIDMA